MGRREPDFDRGEYERLRREVETLGRHSADVGIVSQGVILSFRKWPWTSDFPGVPKFEVFGKDDLEAMRNALLKIKEMEASGESDPAL